jgi:L-threonylcarbamoyladenylate synthase
MITTLRLSANEEGIAQAAALLAAGKLVAFPTETVYGLGCDASNSGAVSRLYAAKGRPSFNPLIAHVAEPDDAHAIAEFSPVAQHLAQAFWPGPLTLVLPAKNDGPVCELARAGLASVAVRMPASTIALAIIRAAKRPIAAPSANRSGHVSPTQAQHVLDDLDGLVDAVVMGDEAFIGIESTILAVEGAAVTMLRSGGLARETIESNLRAPLLFPSAVSDGSPIAPGRLASHYAPQAPLRLDATSLRDGEVVLDFAGQLAGKISGAHRIDLSAEGNLVEAAARLYAALRTLDALAPKGIAVAPVPNQGIGEAINDRLRRAAAPRG